MAIFELSALISGRWDGGAVRRIFAGEDAIGESSWEATGYK